MLVFVSSMRVRLIAVLLLAAFVPSLVAQEEGGDSGDDCCAWLSMEVLLMTGSRTLATIVYGECDEAECIEVRQEIEENEQ